MLHLPLTSKKFEQQHNIHILTAITSTSKHKYTDNLRRNKILLYYEGPVEL